MGVVEETVGESVAFPNALYFDLSEQKWKKADASSIGTLPIEGLALEAKDADEACKILLWGKVRDDSWSWTVDDSVKYIWNSTTAGALSESPPSVATELTQKVGTIRASNMIYFKPDWTNITVPA